MSILKHPEWPAVKEFILTNSLILTKDIKTDGKNAEVIALEVMASNIAYKKIKSVLNKLERTSLPKKTDEDIKSESWK